MEKIGKYICTGCDIGASIDIEKLNAVGQAKAAVSKTHECLCGAEGLDLIKKDIESEGLDCVVIGGCSLRVKTDEFSFGPVVVERVNLREGVAWTQKPNDEDTYMLAEDYMEMGLVKMQKSAVVEPFILEGACDEIMVVGGGVTGMNTALNVANLGYKARIIETADKLGGMALKLHRQYPKGFPFAGPQELNVEELVKKVVANTNIEVMLSTKIEETSGQPGEFQVKAKKGSESVEFKTGGIVQATGWKPYDANKLDHLGYGKFKDVVTNVELEGMAKESGWKRLSDGKDVKNVLFIQCAGSRDKKHLPYCSSVCCNVSLKQAAYLRTEVKDSKAFVVYKDMRTPAQYEEYYRNAQNDPGVFLTKGEVKEVKENPNGGLLVNFENKLLGDDTEVEVDLVVLATGMVSANFEEGEHEENRADQGDALQLTYRQGKELPQFKYGFPDSHYVCFPYETKRTAIYAAGALREPMDMAYAKEDAAGAAMKAIQAMDSVSRGAAVHPRAGDLSFPDFFFQRCTQCKRCTEDCPFGTLQEDDKGTPELMPTRCRRCGICLGQCPERIISFKNYSIDMIGSMIKAIEIPDEDEEKPRVLAFVCENDALPAFDMAGLNKLQLSPYVRVIPVRCAGSINNVWVSDALSAGYDGIMMFGCKSGDDYQCHMIKGSALLATKSENIKETLQKLALEEERIETHEIEISDWHKLPKIIEDFMETMEEVGPNPFKEF